VFHRAIVRPPSDNFAEGLTTVDLGVPDFGKALEQHARYCEALERCGLELVRLPPDSRFPDATFVEDAAVLTPRGGILMRPGAPSREGEVAAIQSALAPHFPALARIEPPGTVDGGDICEAGDHVFIGISARTNGEGARQLARHLAALGYTSSEIDIREVPGILHLKSGIAAVSERRLAVIEPLSDHPAFQGFDRIAVDPAESYAANCVRVNDALLVAAGRPTFAAAVRRLGLPAIELATSEFEKMDGGLSCLSLRF
jgi:dimethylargininase